MGPDIVVVQALAVVPLELPLLPEEELPLPEEETPLLPEEELPLPEEETPLLPEEELPLPEEELPLLPEEELLLLEEELLLPEPPPELPHAASAAVAPSSRPTASLRFKKLISFMVIFLSVP